jgi:DNA-binding SARP family transcriptional activator
MVKCHSTKAMNPKPRLELYLLGPFLAHLDGEPIVSFRSDSTRALLAYLALHPGIAY